MGFEALQTYVEGRSHISSSTGNSKYVDGQEHLIFLEAVQERYNLGIVSTIPEYYLRTKLGFETFDRLKTSLREPPIQTWKESQGHISIRCAFYSTIG